jgi:hypothetical protein
MGVVNRWVSGDHFTRHGGRLVEVDYPKTGSINCQRSLYNQYCYTSHFNKNLDAKPNGCPYNCYTESNNRIQCNTEPIEHTNK